MCALPPHPGRVGASARTSTGGASLAYPHAQHLLLNGHSLHCHPTFGWNTPASIARNTSDASLNKRTFAARSRVVQ